MTRCYLGLGSNLNTPQRQLRQALMSLSKLPRSVIVAKSMIYSSKAYGVRSQPTFCNMVIAVDTTLSAQDLLYCCQRIEKIHQRVRKKRWGPRTLDIDLLLYSDCTIRQAGLKVPHPEMINRDFVLTPLLEIYPQAKLPNGDSLSSYLKHCETHLHPLH